MKKAVIYARYSTEKQDGRSIEDQITQAEATAKRFGYEVAGTYSDRALSGASMLNRPGLLKLMQAAHKDANTRPFDAVICETLSRISRDEADMMSIFNRLNHKRITIIDVHGEVTDIQAAFGAIMNAQFRKNLAIQVRRSMKGRAREGSFMSKVNYGHRGIIETLPNGLTRFKPGVREIAPEKAAIVLRIFEEVATGRSMREIATGLMRDKIASPRGGTAWNYQKLRQMLTNEIYIGKMMWNASTWDKDPESNKRVNFRNRDDEKVVADVPHLRIVPQDLWDRVQAVLAERSTGHHRHGPRPYRFVNQGQLLTGLLTCGECGGTMIVGQSNFDGTPRVVCSYGHRRMNCTHHKSYCLKQLEATVLAGVKEKLTDRAALLEMTNAYQAQWTDRQKRDKANRSDRDTVQKLITKVTVQIDRIVTAVSDSDEPVKALMAKMKQLEMERASLTEKLRLIDAEANVVTLHPKAIERFSISMEQMHKALTGKLTEKQIAPFRASFRNVFERLVVHPTGKRKPYEVTPYARLGAILGFELFPKIRSTQEMLATQGLLTNVDAPPSRSRSIQDRNTSDGVICLGVWTNGTAASHKNVSFLQRRWRAA